MTDNIESYFKKHLSDETPGEGNWNVPSDDVWNKAAPHIIKKSGIFIRWIYIYIIGALIVAGLTIIFWPSSSPEISSEPDIPVSTKNTEPSIDEPSKITAVPDEQPFSNNENQVAPAQEDIIRESPPKIEQSPTEKLVVYSANDNLLLSAESSPSTVREEIFISFMPSLEINAISTPSYHNMADTLQKEYPIMEFENKKPERLPFNNKNKLAIGAYFAPTYNSTYVSGDLSTGKIETPNTYLYSSNWGIELKYFISNRISVVSGYERSEVKSWSRSLIDFDYDASTEQTIGEGDIENTSAVPMQTPFGEIGTEITYRFPGDEVIADGEVMQSAMETHQDIMYFSIPLGIEYNFIQYARLNWFGEGGLRYNQALKDGTTYNSRILHNGHDMNVVNEVMTGKPNYTKSFLSFYIGTGVNWQFSESFQINGSARYFGNITKVNFQDNLSTYVHGFSLKLGIIYIF